jgi:hypothetical protein
MDSNCPNCSRWRDIKKQQKQQAVDEQAIMVPGESKQLQEDPNCGNPRADEEAKGRCDAM